MTAAVKHRIWGGGLGAGLVPRGSAHSMAWRTQCTDTLLGAGDPLCKEEMALVVQGFLVELTSKEEERVKRKRCLRPGSLQRGEKGHPAVESTCLLYPRHRLLSGDMGTVLGSHGLMERSQGLPLSDCLLLNSGHLRGHWGAPGLGSPVTA